MKKYMVLGVAFGWNYKKGLDVFCVLPKMLGEDYQVVLVGTDENVEAELSNDIIPIRRTQNAKQLAEIYSAADVFVNPTREDNYPTVNMEAIACGTPVVSFNTGGCSETIATNNGMIIEQDDLNDLAKKIVSICENKSVKEKSIVNDIRSKLSADRKFAQYVELYKSV